MPSNNSKSRKIQRRRTAVHQLVLYHNHYANIAKDEKQLARVQVEMKTIESRLH